MPHEMRDYQGVTPTPDAVRAELDRILASDAFANAGRLSRLLRFVVERTLAGEGDQLKEYVLGVEVFDRGDQYDPRLDSIVRVEARRLRSKLDEYYDGVGALDDVLITVPRGSYVPVFAPRAAISAPLPSRRGVFVMVLLTAAVILIVVSISWRSGPAAARDVTIAVLPFEEHSGRADDARLASRLTDTVTSELARIGTLGVVSRTSARQFEGVRRPVREIAQALNATVVMEATVETNEHQIFVTARLVDAALDRKIWVEDFSAPRAEVAILARNVASGAAAAATRPR
jgi:TolB-like protein